MNDLMFQWKFNVNKEKFGWQISYPHANGVSLRFNQSTLQVAKKIKKLNKKLLKLLYCHMQTCPIVT